MPEPTAWSRLTRREKDVVLDTLLAAHRSAKERGVPHANDDRATVLQEAIATWIIASRDPAGSSAQKIP